MPSDPWAAPAGATFSLKLGTIDSFWKSISGIGWSIETVDDPQVDAKGNRFMMQHPGQVDYQDLTCTRGYGDKTLAEWFKKIAHTKNRQKAFMSGSVIVYGEEMQPFAQWDFTDAWPKSLALSDISSSSSELLIETMTLSVNNIERTK